MKGSIKNIAVGLCLTVLVGAAHAADTALNMASPSDVTQSNGTVSRAGDLRSYMLAANEADASNATRNVASAAPAKQAEYESFYSMNKIHRHLGISTLIATFATMVTAPGEGCEGTACNTQTQQPRQRNGTHAKLARATVALAAATIATGILTHWDDVHFENGITDPDNLHALLGITGAVIMAKAVNKSAGSAVQVSHAAQAELGAALMAIGIKLEW